MKEPLFYRAIRPILSGLFTLIYRPCIEGAENIPEEGRIILSGNHTHLFDCLLVAKATHRVVHFVAKAELTEGFGKYIFPKLGIIPLDRSTNGKEAIVLAEEYLNDDKVVAIFPEGTINRTDDVMMPFKGGAVKIASDVSSKIVPFAIKGKYKPFKKGISVKFFPAIEIKRGGLKNANKMLEDTVRNELIKEKIDEKT